MDVNEIMWFGAPALVVVIGVVQLLKQLGLPSRFAGLVAAVVGMAFGGAAHVLADSLLAQSVFGGLVVGLGASGLYSAIKNAREHV